MKYRIIEINPDNEAMEFFIQTGVVHKERVWWFINKNVVSWEFLKDDDVAIKYSSMREAIQAVNELKKREPIYHNIK